MTSIVALFRFTSTRAVLFLVTRTITVVPIPIAMAICSVMWVAMITFSTARPPMASPASGAPHTVNRRRGVYIPRGVHLSNGLHE